MVSTEPSVEVMTPHQSTAARFPETTGSPETALGSGLLPEDLLDVPRWRLGLAERERVEERAGGVQGRNRLQIPDTPGACPDIRPAASGGGRVHYGPRSSTYQTCSRPFHTSVPPNVMSSRSITRRDRTFAGTVKL